MSAPRARVGSRVPEHVYLDGRPLMTAASAAQAAEVVDLLNAGAWAMTFPRAERPTAAQAAPPTMPLRIDTTPLPPFDPLEPPAHLPAERPADCTFALREAGKPAPKSGCVVLGCKDGGMRGCPYARRVGA